MKIIDLNIPLNALDGTPTDSNAGKVLAQAMASQTKGDPIKFYRWAQKFNALDHVKIDDSDLDMLKAWTKSAETLNVLAKAQILAVMYNATEEVTA